MCDESVAAAERGVYQLYFHLGERVWRVPRDEGTVAEASRRAARLTKASGAGGWVSVHSKDGCEIGRTTPGDDGWGLRR